MHPGTRADRLASALDEFVRSSPDVEAAAVVSFDGLPMASALPDDLEEDRLGAMSAALLSLGEQAALGLGRGELNQIFVEGEHGFVFLMSARDQAVLTAVATRTAKIGFMLFEMKRAADRIGLALEGEELPVVAPEATVPETPSYAAPSFVAPVSEAPLAQAPAGPAAAPDAATPLVDLPPPPAFVPAAEDVPHHHAVQDHVAQEQDHAPAPHEFEGHSFGQQGFVDAPEHGQHEQGQPEHGQHERGLFDAPAGHLHHAATYE